MPYYLSTDCSWLIGSSTDCSWSIDYY